MSNDQESGGETSFYLYRVVCADGATKHSSILYDDGASGSRTPEEVRQSLLVAATYAMGEFELPDFDDQPDASLRFELLGPYAVGAPVDALTHAEISAIPEEQRP